MKKEIIEDIVSLNEFIVIVSNTGGHPGFYYSYTFEDGKEGNVQVLIDIPGINTNEESRRECATLLLSDCFRKEIADIHQTIFEGEFNPDVENFLFNRLISKTLGSKVTNNN